MYWVTVLGGGVASLVHVVDLKVTVARVGHIQAVTVVVSLDVIIVRRPVRKDKLDGLVKVCFTETVTHSVMLMFWLSVDFSKRAVTITSERKEYMMGVTELLP